MKTINGRQVYSVSEVNRAAREALENIAVWVEGELSNPEYKPHYRYLYFNLKDENTEYVLPCIAEPRYVFSLPFKFAQGAKLLIFGQLSLFERQGKYQLTVAKIEEAGVGSLQRRLEELKNKLQKEGLFSS